jgi:Flp pilus assembly protein TadD
MGFAELARKGSALLEEGDLEAAARALKEAVALEPGSAAARYDLALALAGLGRDKEALAQAREAASLAPDDPDARGLYGLSLMESGDRDAALAELRAARALAPERGEFANNEGTLHFLAGRFPEARACFEAAVALSPDSADAWYNLRDAYRELGEESLARDADKKLQALGGIDE